MAARFSFSQAAAYRLAIPVAVLCLYAIMAGLWLSGAHSLYFGVSPPARRRTVRVSFSRHACRSGGGRMRAARDRGLSVQPLRRARAAARLFAGVAGDRAGRFGRRATGWVGASLDLLFLLSLVAVLRPRTAKELLILGLAAVSPMTVYALERANNDLVVFLLVIFGAIVFTLPRRLPAVFLRTVRRRWPPQILSAGAAGACRREGRRDRLAIAAAAILALLLFGVPFYPELSALAGIPAAASYFTDAFSARNLPFGFAEALGEGILARSSRGRCWARCRGWPSPEPSARFGYSAESKSIGRQARRKCSPSAGCWLRPASLPARTSTIAAFFFSRCCPGWSASNDRSKTEMCGVSAGR